MHIITLQGLKAITFTVFEFKITQDYATDGRSRAATRLKITVKSEGSFWEH